MEYPKIGRVTSESVHKGTGKTWDQWVLILEKAGARTWTHQEIVAFLKKKHKLGPWWQQGVAMGFEIATGRRVEGQNAKGEYGLTVTKSIRLDVKKVLKFFMSEEGIAIWLQPLFEIAIKPKCMFETQDGYFGEIRTVMKPVQDPSAKSAKVERRIRMSWQDPNWDYSTSVEVMFVARANGSSIVAFNHGKIKDTRVQAKLRARWRKALDELAEKCS
ncbi:MAG: DUF4287 domain-containing protein [Bdellovibrionia bacterium]